MDHTIQTRLARLAYIAKEHINAKSWGGFYYQSFKENNAEIDCEFVCTWACACRATLLSKERELQKGQHSTLISSTYGWVSHISLIRFIRISLSPKIGRVWKNGCLEGPLISSPSALLT